MENVDIFYFTEFINNSQQSYVRYNIYDIKITKQM